MLDYLDNFIELTRRDSTEDSLFPRCDQNTISYIIKLNGDIRRVINTDSVHPDMLLASIINRCPICQVDMTGSWSNDCSSKSRTLIDDAIIGNLINKYECMPCVNCSISVDICCYTFCVVFLETTSAEKLKRCSVCGSTTATLGIPSTDYSAWNMPCIKCPFCCIPMISIIS